MSDWFDIYLWFLSLICSVWFNWVQSKLLNHLYIQSFLVLCLYIYIVSISGKWNGFFCTGANQAICSKGTLDTFSKVKAPGTLPTHFLIELSLRMSGSMSLLVHIPSWRAHRQLHPYLNHLATEFFQILAHTVFKMWVIQKPNKVALWNKRHFEEKKMEITQQV